MNSYLRRTIKTALLSLALAFSVLGFLAPVEPVSAANGLDCQTDESGCDYIALTTIPGATKAGERANPVSVIKNLYGISIGIAAILAVGMIIWAGMEYATAEAITGKSDAKEKWHGALWGLALLLSSYLILRTINVDLVNINIDLGKPVVGSLVDEEKARLQVLRGVAQTSQKNLESSLQGASSGQTSTQSVLDEINKKLKDPNLTAEEKSKLLADYQYASAVNEFRKGEVEIYSELVDINKKIAGKQSASFATIVSKIDSSLENLKNTLNEPLDPRLKLAVEERIKTLQKQRSDLDAVTSVVTNQNRIYTRALDFYSNAKPSSPGMSVEKFRQELSARKIYEGNKSGTPATLIQSIGSSRAIATPEIGSVAKTFGVEFSSGINTALENRVKCYEIATTKGPNAASSAGCKSF